MSHIVNTEVTMCSLELLEIINKARAEFGEAVIEPRKFNDKLEDELEGELTGKKFRLNNNQTETAFYDLTQDQCMLVAMRESKGVRRQVLQKLKNNLSPPPDLADQLLLVETAARMLNVSESGKLYMLGIAAQRHGIDPKGLLPADTVDAPAGGLSAEVTKSLTELTKEFGVEQSVKLINLQLEEAGILRREYRASTGGGKQKGFWSITEAGLYYGKNLTSASNPKETQPHWYVSRFNELMTLLQSSSDTRH